MRNHKQAGFTLIEVMIVVVILGILAAIVVPNVIGKDDKARVQTTKVNLRAIATAIEEFKGDQRRYPTTDEGLDALVHKPSNARTWPPEGGYLKESAMKDPWDNPYQYVRPGSGRAYDLYSLGADGAEGGENYDADIIYE